MLLLSPYDDVTANAQLFNDKDLRWQLKVAVKWVTGYRSGDLGGWVRHNVGELWGDYQDALTLQAYALGVEFEARRRESSRTVWWLRKRYPWLTDGPEPTMPHWWGMHDIHVAHQAVLLYIRPGTYDDKFPHVIGSRNFAN